MGEITSEIKRQALWNDDVVHHSAELEDRVRSADHKTAHEIRRDLERTRVDLDSTVRNLRHRMEWGELASEAFETTKGYVTEKEPDFMGLIKRNPAPIALVAGALGWMLYRGKHENGKIDSMSEQSGEALETVREKGSHLIDSMKQKASDALHSLRQKSSEKMDSMKEKTSESIGSIKDRTSQKISDTGDAAKEKLAETGHAAKEKLHNISDRVTTGTRRTAIQARDQFSEKLQSNPLTVGAVALAVGAACGLAVPLTHQEDRMFHKTPGDQPENTDIPGSQPMGLQEQQDIVPGTGIQYQEGDDLL